MIRVVIVDDEAPARELIAQYLSEYSFAKVAGIAQNGRQAVELINTQKPDLVFLDIQMPGMTGFDVVSKIQHRPRIIFSTAYDEYAIQAFEVQALDYLLKPYTRERFRKAMERIDISPKTELLLSQAKPFLISTSKGIVNLSVDDISHISAYGDYTKMYAGDVMYVSNHGIGYWEEELGAAQFIRIHRSELINLAKLDRIEKEDRRHWAVLKGGQRLPVSRSRLEVLRGWVR